MEEFIVPISRQDLSKRNNSNQYFVSKLVNVQSLPKHISVCEQEFRERGHLFIYNMFDYLYSVLHYWNEVDQKIKEKTWDMLLRSCKKSTPAIIEMINSNLSRDDQTMYRNSVKMNIYLLCQIIELFIIEIHQANQVVEKGKGKKKKAPGSQIDMLDEIEMALNTMSQLFHSQIHKFWDPPVVEEDFVNLVTNTCYKLLENQEFCKNSAIREGITKILIIMISRYNHNLSCSVKLVQLLHSCPHFPTHLVYICRAFISADTISGVIRDILTEICNYSSYDLERDNQASSSFSSFLIDFATEFPNIIIPILPQLKNKLDEDPYSMRNCVLSIFGEVIIQVYSKDNENATKTDSLMEVIEDHVADTNGFVRGKALSILFSIVERCTLPLYRLSKILKLLVGEMGAIFDTSSVARKNAIRIITCIVDLNLSKGLSYTDLKERQDLEKIAMTELEQEISEMPISGEIADIEKQIEFIQEQTEGGHNRTSVSVPIQSQSVAKEMLEKKLCELKGVIYVLEHMMEITSYIESALSDIQCMLSSKVATDVLEAISFFVKVKLSNLVNVDIGIRKMLPHICSKDDSIKAAITHAYKLLYLDVQLDDEVEHRNRNHLIVDSLSQLVVNPTFGELICLEKLIINFVESGDVDQTVIECLWTRFRSTDDQFSPWQKKYALIIFSMVANVAKPFMSKYFNVLLNEGIPRSGFDTLDLQLMEYMCTTIQNLAKARVPKVDKLEETFRLPKNHVLFERLCTLCANTFPLKHKIGWIPLVNEAINTIYLLAENPNIICSKLVSSFANEICISNPAAPNVNDDVFSTATTSLRCRSFMLMRFIDVAGHVAMKQFIHFDVDILAELKRRNAIKEEKDQVKKTIKMERHRKRQTQGTDKNGENLEEEMGLVGATADDAEAEFIRKICENELVTDKSKLITNLLGLVVSICSNVSRFKDKDLQKVASLSLGKMMLIGSRVCMDNIDLLFNMAARSPSEIIRANLIVPLGDLIKRFPTKLEPYTPHLYGRLRDSSAIVRLNALNVLSHLILNDMIKVKGQISEMTTCIVDENPRIVHLSKIFFQELANKDKALYNVMPDIISRLSNPQTGVEEAHFRTIMEYLMPFIQKKNQSENLFEKICMRIQSANDERSWRDLSFCLSLMPFNETMLRALQFNLSSFAGKLHIEEVYTALNDILNNAKKNAKGEIIAVIEEMNTKILQLREQGVEDEEENMNAQRATMKKKMKSKKQRDSAGSRDKVSRSRVISQGRKDEDNPDERSKTRKATKKTVQISQDEPHDQNVVEDDNQSIASSRPRRAQKPVTLVFSDDSSSNEEDNCVTQSRKRNRITEDSSGSEES